MTVGLPPIERRRRPISPALKRPFRADIQGLRAVAVALVLLNHAAPRFAPGGFIGVDVFFVISGFLISSHLLDELHHSGHIKLLRFYSARARRILPAAVFTIAATAAVSVLMISPLRIAEIAQEGIAAALFVPNILFAAQETDYLTGAEPSPFQHFWSLGVEEQFYAVWPVLLLAAFLLGRKFPKCVLAVVGTVAVGSFVSNVIVTGDAQPLAFFSPLTRAWEFAVGALLVVARRQLARTPPALAGLLTWLGLGAILMAALTYSAEMTYPGTAALLPVIGAAVVLGFGASDGHGADAALGRSPLQFVGAISYSLYLVHWPVLELAQELAGREEPLPEGIRLVLIGLSVPVAWIMYRLIEVPFRVKRSLARTADRNAVLMSGLATVLLVASLAATGLVASSLPLTSNRSAVQTIARDLPAGTPYVPSNITPMLGAATEDTGKVYRQKCEQGLTDSTVLSCSFGDVASPRTMAIFGDSHAGRWFGALEPAATALGYKLDTFIKSGCRSEETVEAWNSSANATCATWRKSVVAQLKADPPDVIILANHLGPRPDRDETKQQSDWTAGVAASLDRLPPSSRIITLADNPSQPNSPVLCLSTNLDNADKCSAPRETSLNPAIRRAQVVAAELHGAAVIDLTDFFCNEKSCPAVIGATLVYSDEHHLTATFSRTLAPILERKLRSVLQPR